jgi:hypothetical protein
VFLECDVSSTPREIDLEEIQDYVPPPMTHDYIPTTVVAHHVENAPSSATPSITENEVVPMVDEQQAKNFGANEAPLDNEQEVEPEQPQEEINEPPPERRSQRERKSDISKDYVVYISEDIGKMDDPASYKEAMMSGNLKKWFKAMEDELSSMNSNGVWDLVEISDGAKKVRCKWVYKTKYDSKGKVERFKVRLVAKGFTQREGIDYTEIFSSVSKNDLFRIVMALVAHYDLELHQINVKTVFLNGDLQENIYIVQPGGFVMEGKEHMGCKLKKSIYGLKQAFRQWYLKFDEIIKKFSFIKNQVDNCMR